MKLAGKIALITGAGSGMGRATAILFAKEGATVVVSDINSRGGTETVALIQKDGYQSSFVQADVSRSSDVEKMIQSVVEKYARIDILYNNAGIPMANSPLENIPEEVWDRVLNTNVKSIFLASRIAIPIMKKQGGGVILNTASVSGVRPRPGNSAYTVSKAAAISLTKAMAIEVAPFNIRVNSISPVAAETPMFENFFNDEMKKNIEAIRKATVATIPIGRFAHPEDVAKAALYLASDDASMITGVDLYVDGGRTI
jgi:3-oxoacyl-[acyl-carrier protein] reductase